MSDDDMGEVMAGLRGQFLAALPDHVADIRHAWQTLVDEGAPSARRAAADELLRRAHRLAGNGAMVGFAAISDAASPVEETLRAMLDADKPIALPAELAGQIARLLAVCVSSRRPDGPS
jgi:chemotaxis protein histidine kinase CheA